MKEPMSESTADWRRVFGALANEETRRAYARAVLGIPADLPPARQDKAEKNLRAAGLIGDDGQPDAGVFARTLAVAASNAPKEGVERFLDADGRIDRYPKNHAERLSLLRSVGARTMKHGEELNETELTRRLEGIAADAVMLRRYLVDYGVLLRRPDGSVYRLGDGSD